MRYFSILRYLIVLLALVCTACGTALPTLKPYKLDVQQGNVVTSKMLLQLRPGMTKSQVRFIMGTPLVQDSFHGNRWDYVYQMREGGKVIEQRRVILDFEKELLKTVRGDVIPAGSDPAMAEESAAQSGTRVVAPYKKTEKKGLLDKLKFWEKDEAGLAEDAAKKEAPSKAEPEAAVEVKKEDVPAVQAITPPAEADETKSILAVPVELPAAAEPVSPAPVVDVPKAEAAPERVEPTAPAPSQLKAVEIPTEASPAVTAAPANAPASVSEHAVESAAAPAVVAPRAESAEVPSAEPLPPEEEPGYFDKMLEQIGF